MHCVAFCLCILGNCWFWLVCVSGGVARRSYSRLAMADDDFGPLCGGGVFGGHGNGDKDGKGKTKGTKRKSDGGESRAWLRIYETLPPQLLNAYGVSRYSQLTDDQVWEHLTKPLKTGAQYMTEYASKEEDRRGTAVNRWLLSILYFCQFQNLAKTKGQNQSIMEKTKFDELYVEIGELFPALEYCLAPKKQGQAKSGAAALRAAASVSEPGQASAEKTPEDLDKHAKSLYDWVMGPRSRVRMLMNWQAAGGLSYVASTHQRGTQCFIGYGNKFHEGEQTAVTLEEFQKAVKARHAVGSAGIHEFESGNPSDYT